MSAQRAKELATIKKKISRIDPTFSPAIKNLVARKDITSWRSSESFITTNEPPQTAVVSSNPNANDVKLDLSNLNSGTYIVKIISGENSKAIKISKL